MIALLIITLGLGIAATTDTLHGIIHDLTTLTIAGTGIILLFGTSPATALLTILATVAVLWTGARLTHEQVWRQGDAFLVAATTLASGPFAPLYLFLQIVAGGTWILLADRFHDHLPFAPSVLLAWIPVAIFMI